VTADAVPASAPEERRTLLIVRLLKAVALLLVVAYFVAALGILVLRYVLLPRVDEYRPQLAAALSRSIGRQVTLGHVAASWEGLHARFAVDEVRVHDGQGRVALSLPRIEGAVSWRTLLAGEARFSWLTIDGADLTIRRDAAGDLFVAGLPMGGGGGDSEFVNWLLRQREVAVRGSRMEWHDELRGAPPLALDALELHLVNRSSVHRFAVRALPPPGLASALEVRGELHGRTFDQLRGWNGRLYAEIDRVDLAAWKAWVDYPLRLDKGAGGVRFWVSMQDQQLTEAVVDVALADVAARLAPDLPMLELEALHGRIGARGAQPGSGFVSFLRGRQPGKEIFGRNLAFGLRGEPDLAPSDFTLRWEPRGEGTDGVGELRAASLELAPLAALAERLPLPLVVRRLLQASEPAGQLTDLVYKWQGSLDDPTRYGARGQFARLGMKAHGELPGFSALAGSFELDERSGSARIDTKNAKLSWPALFVDTGTGRPIALDVLTGRVAWTHAGGVVDVSWDDFAFAGPEAAGTVRGRWKSPGAPGGGLELAVDGTRAEARSAFRFIPRIKPEAEHWLRTALRAGTVSDLKLRLKGNPDDFPFDDPARGTFELTMKVADGSLHFAPDWPAIEGIGATLKFERRRMDIHAHAARTLGVALGPTRAVMERLIGAPHILFVEGGAEAPGADMLRYVASSPVASMTGNAFAGMSIDGRAKLGLRLELPLDRMEAAKVAGTVQLTGNTVLLGADEPALTQVAGVLDFSERGVSARGLSAQLLGGPTTLSIGTREDRAVTFSAQGTALVAELGKRMDAPFAARLSGAAGYRASGAIRGKGTEVVVESTLEGVAIDLPAPFGKAAGDVWPSRIERLVAFTGEGRDRQRRDTFTASFGTVANLKGLLRVDAEDKVVLDRLGVALGEVQATLPREPGVALTGRLASLDVDQLLPLTKDGRSAGLGELRSIDLKVGQLVAGGRRVHDVALAVQLDSGGWQAKVGAREVTGNVSYRSADGGKVVARLQELTVPAASDPNPGRRTLDELPALDIVAESFRFGGHGLGRLELVAENVRDEWRIDRLDVVAPEGAARLRGTWRPADGTPQRTDVTFTIEASDVGAYLARIGVPHTVDRGVSTLSGKVAWNGPVYSIDYPSLFGNARLTAEKGQFLRIKPGIGKLLGVLSLQALPRRVTLDFRDVFSEGFAFDTLAADVLIARGVLSTTDFVMSGPAASVTMRGIASLADETQDLHVRVVPSIGDNVAAAAGLALVNPMLGLGALVAGRVLKDPIGQMLAYEYHVTGAWDDPKVERVGRVGPEAQSMLSSSETAR
jgi:uncharacterized protein (TIGR02099 family)